jgi:hypothetical protein
MLADSLPPQLLNKTMKQTAVEWLLENIAYIPMGFEIDIIKQAKEMEKERIMKAHISAGARLEDISIEAAEQYYNETFKSE